MAPITLVGLVPKLAVCKQYGCTTSIQKTTEQEEESLTNVPLRMEEALDVRYDSLSIAIVVILNSLYFTSEVFLYWTYLR